MLEPDILIVGGGSAGCVLAARLSEDPALRVCLVEAGHDIDPADVPADIADQFPRSYANMSYFSHEIALKQPSGPPRPFLQPRILGGGSSVMGMWSLRGLAEDYDNWAAAGATGWSYSELLPYFRRLETDLDFSDDLHGHNGPVTVRRLPRNKWPGFISSFAAAADCEGLHLRKDLNTEWEDGVYSMPIAYDKTRATTATAYLTSEVRRRSNLQILCKTTAQKLEFHNGRIDAIHLTSSDNIRIIQRPRLVILSAGAIHTPALLMRSGSGDPAMLKAVGISPVMEAKEVGRNLRNHAFFHLGAVIARDSRQPTTMRQYITAALRMSSGAEGASAGDLLLGLISRSTMHTAGNRLGMIAMCLVGAQSTGQVALRDKGISIDFNMLSHPSDRAAFLSGARQARKLLNAVGDDVVLDRFMLPRKPPIQALNREGRLSELLSFGLASASVLPSALRRQALGIGMTGIRWLDRLDDESFDKAALSAAAPMFHPAGTCAIGRVVTPELQLIGCDNCYVADASVMPLLPRANTNIPTIMIAERAAEFIRRHIMKGSPGD